MPTYSPIVMSLPGSNVGDVVAQNQQTGGGGVSRSPFVYNGALYCVLQYQGNGLTPSLIYVIKSTNNGVTWANLDFANSPQTSTQPAPNPPSNGSTLFDPVLEIITVAFNNADVSAGTNQAIKLRDFSLVTETWGADYATVGAPSCFGCNQLFRRSDASVVFLHNTNPPAPTVNGLTASVFAAGIWSSFAVDTNIGGGNTSNSGSSAVLDPLTDIIHCFLTTKGAGNINFVTYQQILPNNTLGVSFNFTNEFANLGTTGAIVEAMGNPVIVGDNLVWGQVPPGGTVPSVMVGTPLASPVFTVLASPGIDTGFPGAQSSTIQPTLAFDGTTLFAVYVFLANDFLTHIIRLAQTTNLANPLLGWTAQQIYDDQAGGVTWDLGVQFPTVLSDPAFSTAPLITTQGVISAFSPNHLTFWMGGVTPPNPVVQSVVITMFGWKLYPISPCTDAVDAIEAPHIKVAR